MLPFLDPKKVSSVIISKRKDKNLEVKSEVDSPDNKNDSALEDACHGIMAALDQKSVKDLALAIKEAFLICDSAPHVEGEHLEEK